MKARGLTDAVVGRLSNINSKYLKNDKLKEILTSMKLPVVSSTPLHLEIVIQIEGKSVLSYYLNQTTFQNLTDGDCKSSLDGIISIVLL